MPLPQLSRVLSVNRHSLEILVNDFTYQHRHLVSSGYYQIIVQIVGKILYIKSHRLKYMSLCLEIKRAAAAGPPSATTAASVHTFNAYYQ